LLVCGINLVVFLLSIAAVLFVRPNYIKHLGKIFPDFEPSSIFITAAVGFAVFAILSALNIIIIRKKCP
jgi:hypothetical protein